MFLGPLVMVLGIINGGIGIDFASAYFTIQDLESS